MRISNKSFKELIIITSLNTGSVKVIGSSPIRSTTIQSGVLFSEPLSFFKNYFIFLFYSPPSKICFKSI